MLLIFVAFPDYLVYFWSPGDTTPADRTAIILHPAREKISSGQGQSTEEVSLWPDTPWQVFN